MLGFGIRREMLLGGRRRLSYANKVLAMSPVAYWPLNETTGLTAINYGSLGGAANGVYDSHVILASVDAPGGGKSPRWSSTNTAEQVNIYSAALNGAFNGQLFSIAVWWKVFDVSVWTNGTNHYVFDVGVDSTQHVWTSKTATNGNVQNRSISSEVVTASHSETGWVFTVLTMSKAANQFMVYENGVQVGTTQAVPDTWTGALGSGNCHIGNSRNLSYPWKGYISQVAIWDRVLTPAEIASLYTAGFF
jgi:hypothetical protein